MLLFPGARSPLLADSPGPSGPAPHPQAGRTGQVFCRLCLEQLGNRRRWSRAAGPTGLLLALALTYEPARQTPPAPAPPSWLCSAPRCWHGRAAALSPAQPRSRSMDGKISPVSAGGSGRPMDPLPSGFGGGTGLSRLLSGVLLHSSRREKEPGELPEAALGTWREGSQQHPWCLPRAGRGVKALRYFAALEL